MTLNFSVCELVENVGAPFERARAMPPSVYTSKELLDSELGEVFAKEWICVSSHLAVRIRNERFQFVVYEQVI